MHGDEAGDAGTFSDCTSYSHDNVAAELSNFLVRGRRSRTARDHVTVVWSEDLQLILRDR